MLCGDANYCTNISESKIMLLKDLLVSNVEGYFNEKIYNKVMRDPRFSSKHISGLIHKKIMQRFGGRKINKDKRKINMKRVADLDKLSNVERMKIALQRVKIYRRMNYPEAFSLLLSSSKNISIKVYQINDKGTTSPYSKHIISH